MTAAERDSLADLWREIDAYLEFVAEMREPAYVLPPKKPKKKKGK